MMLNAILISLLLFLLGLVSVAADTKLSTSKTAKETKDLFVVVPRKNIDVSSTVDFIKATVQDGDLTFSTDVDEQLLSWIVNATTDQVGNLRDHDGIERVIRLKSLHCSQSQSNTYLRAIPPSMSHTQSTL